MHRRRGPAQTRDDLGPMKCHPTHKRCGATIWQELGQPTKRRLHRTPSITMETTGGRTTSSSLAHALEQDIPPLLHCLASGAAEGQMRTQDQMSKLASGDLHTITSNRCWHFSLHARRHIKRSPTGRWLSTGSLVIRALCGSRDGSAPVQPGELVVMRCGGTLHLAMQANATYCRRGLHVQP
jgi:hypothetical protein